MLPAFEKGVLGNKLSPLVKRLQGICRLMSRPLRFTLPPYVFPAIPDDHGKVLAVSLLGESDDFVST